MHFVNDTVGWASGAQGYILKTEDGGNSWSETYLDIGMYQFLDSYFVNQDTGWVVGGDSIFKTTDGGDTWESLKEMGDYRYYSCYFINSNSGWVGATYNFMSRLIYTADGGNSWLVQDSMGGYDVIYSLFFNDEKTGWGVGSGGHILKTSSGGIVSVGDVRQSQNVLPEPSGLHQNYPNPFSSLTTISYDLPVSGHVSLIIYNLLGEEVIRLVDRKQSAGRHDLTIDASGLAGGIYYYQLSHVGRISVKKMLLVR